MGYQLNRYLGFERGYFNLGKRGTQVTTTPLGTLNAELRGIDGGALARSRHSVPRVSTAFDHSCPPIANPRGRGRCLTCAGRH